MITLSLIVHSDFTHIAAALQSIRENTAVEKTVIVTINSGDPDSIRSLQQQFPECSYIINKAPLGFASNHNAVMRRATTPYVALLNDDITLEPSTLQKMMDYLNHHPEVGLASPLVKHADGSSQKASYNDPSLLRMVYKISGLGYLTREGSLIRQFVEAVGPHRLGLSALDNRQETRFVPVVVGVAMFARREAYLIAGLMDEDTKVFGEEFGWQKRIRDAGWKVALVADTKVIHLNDQQDLSGWKLAEHRKGILNYFVRYSPKWQQYCIRAAIALCHLTRAVFLVPFNRTDAHANWLAFQVAFWSPKRDQE